jgi:hypothetical protein
MLLALQAHNMGTTTPHMRVGLSVATIKSLVLTFIIFNFFIFLLIFNAFLFSVLLLFF